MLPKILFVTGTDTGVGKTAVTALLARHLRNSGVAVAALKPLSSGDRQDARALHSALNGTLSLDEINPWHFRAPLAPLLAARRQRIRVKLAEVVACVRSLSRRFEIVLIEGAGGLLSPLGEDFNARDLISHLRALPIVVCPNRLGAIGQTLLVLAALPAAQARRCRVVLISPRRPDRTSRSNQQFLVENLGAERVHRVPWLSDRSEMDRILTIPKVRRSLDTLLGIS